MSGPKVVRIVTIGEVREICHGHLARLDAAIARWEKVCLRNDVATGEDIRSMRARRSEIAALMDKGLYLDLQKRAPQEIQWIEADLERRLEEAARRAADVRVRERRRAALAAQLLQATSLSPALRPGLEAIVRRTDTDAAQAEKVIGEALRAMPARDDEQANAGLEALRQRRSTGQQRETLDDWLAANKGNDDGDSASDKIEIVIAGLAIAGAIHEAEVLAARYRAIASEPSAATRKMRADTMLIEAARALERRRVNVRQLADLSNSVAEARTVLDASQQGVLAEADEAIARDDGAAAVALNSRLTELIATGRKTFAAAARRHAVLSALAEIGYEAREGLETAQPADGRLVLRRATNHEMGVEIAGGAAGERLQLRPVRFAPAGSTGDASKDRDIETIWCGDFDKLRDGLGKLDADMAIERALPVGATPVMVVEQADATDARRTSTPAPRRTRST